MLTVQYEIFEKGVTYITEVCSSKSINLGFWSTKNCTASSECLSNKCYKDVQCQTVRYKEHCGLLKGYECEFDKECSSL
ncbi:hypothetical protein BCR32DRAFT_277667 [Anaeromyces robustus]|uniref:Uncharacterized protein n=1 Tax=Anaeromyces robustus TaxID=1754192 RepID=A0A1Y1XEP6_9FUNG|nr:hypothetical protein BCR32DRAFT_277667 [Anaeromyces robustus]|eukprot:ORX83844.1 hypothetical protein BCR32DRAFT_277667 [Anaeromyces robustus]